jgi:hypothetical protein
MRNLSEKEKIEYNKEELISGFDVLYTIKSENSGEQLSLIKDVMLQISKYNSGNWPNDDEWYQLLPGWFLEKARVYSIEDAMTMDKIWHFESWLDAMRYREWEWIGSCIKENKFFIYLKIINLPSIIEPFEFIMFIIGIEEQNITYKENW